MTSENDLTQEKFKTHSAEVNGFVKEMKGISETIMARVEGFKHSQNISTWFVGLLVTICLTLSVFIMQQVFATKVQIGNLSETQK